MLEHRGWLAEASVLDLFAGSGALGIEALSRGAERALFVESSASAARALRENLRASGFAARAEVLDVDAPRALRTLARSGRRVDGILADPPYGRGWPARLMRELGQTEVLAPDGWIALEHEVDEAAEPPAGFTLVSARRHGRTAITLLARSGDLA